MHVWNLIRRIPKKIYNRKKTAMCFRRTHNTECMRAAYRSQYSLVAHAHCDRTGFLHTDATDSPFHHECVPVCELWSNAYLAATTAVAHFNDWLRPHGLVPCGFYSTSFVHSSRMIAGCVRLNESTSSRRYNGNILVFSFYVGSFRLSVCCCWFFSRIDEDK